VNRSVIVYAVLLAAALAAAYLSWTDEPDTSVSEGVVVADFPAEDVERIEYSAPDKELSVTAKSDDGDRYWWVEATRQVDTSPPDRRSPHGRGRSAGGPDAGSADAGSPDAGGGDATADAGRPGANREGASREPETTTEREIYRASSVFDRFLDDISPLRARRKLPEPDEQRRRAYGFDGETKKLVVTAADDSHTFTIGNHTYGRQHIYLRDEASGDYFVVEAGVIGPFKFDETRLKEQRVMAEGEKQLTSVAVSSDGRSVELFRHNRDDPSAAYWSFGEDAKTREETAQAWIDKLLRVQIKRYVDAERPDDLQPRLVVRLEPTDGETTSIEFFERETDQGTEYFARSDYTKMPVELKRSSASTLIADLPTLFDGADE